MDDDGTAQERASLGLDDQEIGKYIEYKDLKDWAGMKQDADWRMDGAGSTKIAG